MQRRRLSIKMGLLCAASGFGLVGCSGDTMPEGIPALHPIVLTVSQGGMPVEGVSVQLLPQDPANARWASGGATDMNGTVVVKTLGEYEGAPAGKYKVTFYKEMSEGTSGTAVDDPSVSTVTKAYSLVDPKFQSPDTTPVEIEVASGTNAIPPIDLGTPVRIIQKTL